MRSHLIFGNKNKLVRIVEKWAVEDGENGGEIVIGLWKVSVSFHYSPYVIEMHFNHILQHSMEEESIGKRIPNWDKLIWSWSMFGKFN